MKKIRQLASLVLVICMLSTMITMHAEQTTEPMPETLLGPLTFDDCEDLDDVRALGVNIAETGTRQKVSLGAKDTGVTISPSLKIGRATEYGVEPVISETGLIDGYYKISYWMYIVANTQVIVDIPATIGSEDGGAVSLIHMDGRTAYVNNQYEGSDRTSGDMLKEWTRNEAGWHRFEHLVDMDGKTIKTVVYTTEDTKVVESQTYAFTNSVQEYTENGITAFKSFRIRNKNTDSTYIDNILVTKEQKTEEPGDGGNTGDGTGDNEGGEEPGEGTEEPEKGVLTFDGCENLQDLKDLGLMILDNADQNVSVGSPTPDDPQAPSIKVEYAATLGVEMVVTDQPVTEGAYKIGYWYYHSQGCQMIVEAPMAIKSWAGGAFSLLHINANKAYVDNYIKGSITPGPMLTTLEENKWYCFEHIIDLNDWTVQGIAYDAAGNLLGKSEPYTIRQWMGDRENEAITHFQSFRIKNWSKTGIAYLDNMKASEYFAPPSIARKNISFRMLDGSIQLAAKEMAPGVDSIVLNFGTQIDATSAASGIKLVKDGTSVVPVSYTGTPYKNQYIMELTDILEPNAKYVLTINDSITNSKGVKLNAGLTYEFVTTAGGFEARVVAINNNGEPISGMASVSGSAMSVDVKYQNLLTENKSITCIAGYYDANNRMTGKTVSVIPAGTKTAGTVSIPLDAVPENINSIKVFLWDGMETMQSYQQSVVGYEKYPVLTDKEGEGCQVSYDYHKQQVVVYGTSTEDVVRIQVLKAGESFTNLEKKTPTEQENALLYAMENKTKDGRYGFVIGYDDADLLPGSNQANTYQVRLCQGTSMQDMTLSLMPKSVYIGAVSGLNAVAADTSKSDAEFASALKDQVIKCNFNIGSLSTEELTAQTAKAYRAYLASAPMDEKESEKNQGTLLNFMVQEAAQKGKALQLDTAIHELYFEEADLKDTYLSLATSEISKGYFETKFKEAATGETASMQAFAKAWKSASILTCARYGAGWGTLKNLVLKYAIETSLTTTASDTRYQELMGGDYTMSAFQTALAQTTPNVPTPGGGGGGGGGGSMPPKPQNTTNSLVNSGVLTMDGTVLETSKPITMNFTDIDGVAWASEAILALADKGIIHGKGDKLFRPNDTITREEFVKILVGSMNLGEETYTNHFSDVEDTDWFCKWVNIAYEKGLCMGVGKGTFGIGQALTRQDMVVLLEHALSYQGFDFPEKDNKEFLDAGDISDYALDAVDRLVSIGAIKGISETNFGPREQSTRAQAATVIYRVLEELQAEKGEA